MTTPPPPPPAPDGGATSDPAWPPRPPEWRHDAPDPPEAFPVAWTVFDGVGLVLWTIVAQALVAIPLTLSGYELTDVVTAALAFLLIELVILAGTYGWLRGRGCWSWRLLGPVRPAWRHVWVGVGVGVSGFLLANIIVLMFQASTGIVTEPPDQALLDSAEAGGAAAILSAIVAILFAPVIEELIFRGVLFQSLRRRLGLWPGIGISSLVFAVVHFEVTQPLYASLLLLFGAWLAASFHRTGSLIVPIVGHATFNGIAVALTVAASGSL